MAGGGEHGADEARSRGGFFHGGKIAGEMIKVEAAVNPDKAAGSGTAKKAQQNGFGLVVASVSGGHAVEAESDGGALEKCVAGTAPGGFQREMKERGKRSDIFRLDGGLKRKLRRQIADETLVRIGLCPAQPVIEMEDERHDSQAGSKLDEGAQQRHGISASADGHANAFAWTYQTMLAHVKFERP